MATYEVVSADGSWKIVVEAWSTSLIVYSAMGITTRVYVRGFNSWWDQLWGTPIGWVSSRADFVNAAGSVLSSRMPGASMSLPGSPDNRQNDSVADCRVWAIGGGITIKLSADFQPTGVEPARSSADPLADRVSGSGRATRNGETLSVGSIIFPP